MVDPINGVGGVQGLNRAQGQRNAQENRVEVRGAVEPQDEIAISQEAVELAEVERATQEVRRALESDATVSLGLDRAFSSDV